MKKTQFIIMVLVIMTGVVITSCVTFKGNKNAYAWGDYNNATYSYMRLSDSTNTNYLSNVYTKLISLERVPPTVCADYGYLLLKANKQTEGKALLLKEEELYPESKVFIDKFLNTLQK